MKLLVTGGAGYIGSHMVAMLMRHGHAVTVLDNLSSGSRAAIFCDDFVLGDVGDRALLDDVFASRGFDGVLHFASLIEVGESVKSPGRYYETNVSATLALLNAMVAHAVPRIIVSSSAAVYGNPQYLPIDEAHPTSPVNPYGMTKLVVEQMLRDFRTAHGLRSIALRYFNAAGADPAGRNGSRKSRESHLIPNVLRAASGRNGPIQIYGDDYETRDGSCVRDYVHVDDLCRAHLLALKRIDAKDAQPAYNLGCGGGFTVLEVIRAAERISGRKIPLRWAPRRAGDPPQLIANAALAHSDLGWTPRFSNLEKLITDAWSWELKMAAVQKPQEALAA